MSTQKHTPELVEAALGYVKNLQCPADKLSAFLEYRRSHESLALEECVEKILRSHIAALTEENAQLKTILRLSDSDSLQAVQTEARHIKEIRLLRAQLAAFEGAESLVSEVQFGDNAEIHLFSNDVREAVWPLGIGDTVYRVPAKEAKPSKQEETP